MPKHFWKLNLFLVACRWAGAVQEKLTSAFGQEQWAQKPQKCQKSKKGTNWPTNQTTNQPTNWATNQPTNWRTVELRSTRLTTKIHITYFWTSSQGEMLYPLNWHNPFDSWLRYQIIILASYWAFQLHSWYVQISLQDLHIILVFIIRRLHKHLQKQSKIHSYLLCVQVGRGQTKKLPTNQQTK